MRDKVTIARVAELHPKIRGEVRQLIDTVEAGFPEGTMIRVVQGLRSIEEQNALYAQGRSKAGHIVTNAKGGSSYHNYGLAIDFAIMYGPALSWDIMADKDKDGVRDWLEVVDVFKAAGYEFGGDWKSLKDYPHLQKTFGHSWQDLYQRWATKKFIEGSTVYLDL